MNLVKKTRAVDYLCLVSIDLTSNQLDIRHIENTKM